ncbi:MAG: hypothetical protein KI792_10250 [Alphaproteobacteria bacterium]|nr:hypothetical protein [Alphaproteobacteria bacterium SS10]
MAKPQGKNIELYKVVEEATRLVGEIQREADRNQDQLSYVGRRADRRLSNPHRLAKIWSEGQLQEAEDRFDRVRDGEAKPEDLETGQPKKRRKKKGAASAEDEALWNSREQLFGIWNSLRKDNGFKNAAKQVKKAIGEAGKEVKKREKQGKHLEQALNKTIAAVRDMKQAMSAGIRQVPYEAALDAGPSVAIDKRVAAFQRVSAAAMSRAQPQVAPAPQAGMNPSAGGLGDASGNTER